MKGRDMNLKQLAEMLLTAREVSRRIGSSFEIHFDRLSSLGINPDDLPLVLSVVTEIEQHREHQLSLLDRP